MRIALLSSGLGHVTRGIEGWTRNLGAYLTEQGLDVTVFKGSGKADGCEIPVRCLRRKDGVNQFLLKYRPKSFWRFGFANNYTLEQVTFSFGVFLTILLGKYDVLHTKDPITAIFFQRCRNLRLIKSKIILGHGTEEPFEFLKKLDYVQHLAPYHQQEAEENGVVSKKAFAVGNFVFTSRFQPGKDDDFRREIGIPNNAFVVLSSAAINKWHKRIDYLISEVKKIKAENIYLVVAGNSNEETAEVVQMGKEMLGDKMIFLKDFSCDDMPKVYKIADIFALCSLKDMMPNALLEALASGLPSLVHQYPVEEWIIGDGGTAIDMSKEGELASWIFKYLNDKLYRNKKSDLARKQAVDNFSREKIVKKTISMYKEVIND